MPQCHWARIGGGVRDHRPLTAPARLLFMFFMITDPMTTTRSRARQCAVAIWCVLRARSVLRRIL
jgi:hypothetical protein